MKTLTLERRRLLEDAAHDSARAADGACDKDLRHASRTSERAAANLDQVLMELDDE